ncbi:MAG TPA: PQQ-binding-like beta-propeller repeat protein [Gemmatimonadaceae bacterium]|nr:PQQ-binding-like beta-propeller repeat protein [Gemmatimonadaceae bacterium]
MIEHPLMRAAVALTLASMACIDCHNPAENKGGGTGVMLWHVPLSDVGSGWTGLPTIAGSTVYLETTNAVLALDLTSGAKHWQTVVKTNPSPAAANIVAAGGAVYLAEAVEVISLDAASGAIRWRFTPDAQAAAAQSAVDDHAVYVGTRSHKVYALSPATGQPLWTTDIGADWPYLGVVMGLSVSGDTVYAGAVKRLTATGDSSVGIIAGLDRNTGALLFRYEAPQSVAASGVSSSPVIRDRVLFASDLGGAFYAIDRFTLRELWRVRTAPGFFGPFARASLAGTRLYIGTNDTYVYATDAATGNVIWQTSTKASIHESAVCGQRVFANNLGIFILDISTGRILQTLFDDDPNEIPSSGFAVASDRVVFSGVHGAYALACQ